MGLTFLQGLMRFLSLKKIRHQDPMSTSSHRVIATRRLTYAFKDDPTQWAFTVCISEPYLLTKEMVDYDFVEGTACCVISFDGLAEKEHTVMGADSMQALELALGSAEDYLRRLSKKYDFYFEGDPYFDDEASGS